MPLSIVAAHGRKYLGVVVWGRVIWLTLTGCRIPPCLEPKYAPMADSGAEIPNQSTTIRSIVVNGTAPDEPAMIRKRLRRNTTIKMNDGKTVAVKNAFFLRSVPPRDA